MTGDRRSGRTEYRFFQIRSHIFVGADCFASLAMTLLRPVIARRAATKQSLLVVKSGTELAKTNTKILGFGPCLTVLPTGSYRTACIVGSTFPHLSSKAESGADFVFLEAHDNLLSDYDRRKCASGCQSLYLFKGFLFIRFGQQINVREFKFDPAISEKSLARFTVAARAQGVKFAYFHQRPLFLSMPQDICGVHYIQSFQSSLQEDLCGRHAVQYCRFITEDQWIWLNACFLSVTGG